MSADGSQAGISYIKEVSWGVTPTGQFAGVNFTEEDMKFSIENKASNNVRPDRQTAELTQVGAECAGGINTEFQASNLDTLLPGFFMEADWTTNVLKNGVVRSSYSIERANYDATQFFLYKGMVPNVMEVTIEVDEPVVMALSFVGKDETLAQATASTPAPIALVTKPIINSGPSIGEIAIDGTPLPSCLVEKAIIKLDNQVEGKKAVSVLGFCDAKAKSLMVTGTLTMFFEDETYYDKYLAGTAFKLTLNMTDSLGNKFDWELPKCKFDDGSANVTGKDDDVMEEHTFVALVGAAEGYTIQLTRTVI